MQKNKEPLLFKIIKKFVIFFYKRYDVEEMHLIENGNFYISNHAQLHGPLSLYLYFPYKKYIWVIGQMCNRKEAYPYAMDDFWRNKRKHIKWLFKIFARIIVAPFAPYLFKYAKTIPVYKDTRLRNTIKQTIVKLCAGENIIIFPENRNHFNKYINDFQIHFVDIAKPYYQKTGIKVKFYPVYTCPNLKKIIIGKPIIYNPKNNLDIERKRIITYLQTEITKIGDSLPNHKIIPYDNIKKKLYKYSK